MHEQTTFPAGPRLDPTFDFASAARLCRGAVLEQFALINSCIETAFLLERMAFHRGVATRRMVCQATAFSPLLAKAMCEGEDVGSLAGRPGYWAVAVGSCPLPGDYVGMMDVAKNRYVGHVICIADDLLIDPSSDQMSRPAKGLDLPLPVLTNVGEGGIVVAEVDTGAVVRYVLHPDVPIPRPKSDRILERLAKQLALRR